MANQLTFAEQLKKHYDSLSPAERRVSRVLIADYPVAGLEPVHRLADRSNVSSPTVLRLIAKLGIPSYPEFQRILRDEISARSSSPLEMYETQPSRDEDRQGDVPFLETSRRILQQGLNSTFDSIPAGELREIVRRLADRRNRVWIVGGRFSDLLAQYLSLHLRLLRKDVHHIGQNDTERTFALLDFGSQDLLVAFDYRRYQEDTFQFLRRAKERKVTILLFTDPWLSPSAKYANFLLSSSVSAPSPFDSQVSAFALVETVIAGVVEELGEAPKGRIEAFDELQQQELNVLSSEASTEPSSPQDTPT